MLILRCVHLGALPHPLPGARLSGSCLSCEVPVPWRPLPSQAQGDASRNNHIGAGQLSSPGVSSRSNYRSLPVRTGLGAPGQGALTFTVRGHPEAAASSLCCALPASACLEGSEGSWSMSPGASGSGACPAT